MQATRTRSPIETTRETTSSRDGQTTSSVRCMYVYLNSGSVDVVPLVSRTEITNDRVILYGIIEGIIAADYPRRDVYSAGDVLMSPAF